MARFSCPRIHPRDANIARRARNQRRKGMLDAWSRIGDICLLGPACSPSRRRREVNALRPAVRGPGVPKGVESAGGVRCQRDLRAKVSGFAILRLTAWRCALSCFFQVCAFALFLLTNRIGPGYDAALARCCSRHRAGGTPSQVRKARTKEFPSSYPRR
jgi:hypothetical protein